MKKIIRILKNLRPKKQSPASDDSFSLDVEDVARLCNARWEATKRECNLKFMSATDEWACQNIFIRGYHAALTDMHEITSGAVALDEILKNDKQ